MSDSSRTAEEELDFALGHGTIADYEINSLFSDVEDESEEDTDGGGSGDDGDRSRGSLRSGSDEGSGTTDEDDARASEIDELVENGNWDGVVAVAARCADEAHEADGQLPPCVPDPAVRPAPRAEGAAAPREGPRDDPVPVCLPAVAPPPAPPPPPPLRNIAKLAAPYAQSEGPWARRTNRLCQHAGCSRFKQARRGGYCITHHKLRAEAAPSDAERVAARRGQRAAAAADAARTAHAAEAPARRGDAPAKGVATGAAARASVDATLKTLVASAAHDPTLWNSPTFATALAAVLRHVTTEPPKN